MCTTLTILLLGLVAVTSAGSNAVCSIDCVPIKDLNHYQALVLKPTLYPTSGEDIHVKMSVQLTGPQDTLAIKLIANHPEGKAFDEIVSGSFQIQGDQSKKYLFKKYSDNLTDKKPESKLFHLRPIKALEATYSTSWTAPGNITEKYICIERVSDWHC